jgi:hypothetical protein
VVRFRFCLQTTDQPGGSRACPGDLGGRGERLAGALSALGSVRHGDIIGAAEENVERLMDRQKINRIGALAPIAMSLLALLVLAVAMATGWERGLKDEGAVAHIFQLLIMAQAPLIVLFLATANWRRFPQVVGSLALQAVALAVAFAPVAFFKL